MHINNDVLSLHDAILSDVGILDLNKEGLLVEQPLTDTQIQPNSIDLTLGNTWKKIKPNVDDQINPKYSMKYSEGLFEKSVFNSDEGFYCVEPGEFVLMASKEILNIPNGLVGFVCGRSSIARLGIQTEQAGFIDSGFRGTITLEVYNQTKYPIVLYSGMRVAQVYFIKAQKSGKLYGKDKGSKYNDQISATGSRIHLDPEFNRETWVDPHLRGLRCPDCGGTDFYKNGFGYRICRGCLFNLDLSNKKGRPKKYQEGRERTKSILIRLTPSELVIIDEKMNILGLSNRESFIRDLLLKGEKP